MAHRRMAALVLCVAVALSLSGCRQRDYNAAISLTQFDEWASAREIFVELGNYRRAPDRVKQCDYHFAEVALEEKRYDDAVAMFEALGDYQDSKDRILECRYLKAKDALRDECYEEAAAGFAALGSYSDSAEKALECRYRMAQKLYLSGNFAQAIAAFREAQGYEDAEHYIILAMLRSDPQGFIQSTAEKMNAMLSDIRLEAAAPIENADERSYTAEVVPDELNVTVTFSHENARGETTAYGQINRMTVTAQSYTAAQRGRAEGDFLALSSALMAVLADTQDPAECEAQLVQRMEEAEAAVEQGSTFRYQGCDCRVTVSDPGGDSTRSVFTVTVPELVQ